VALTLSAAIRRRARQILVLGGLTICLLSPPGALAEPPSAEQPSAPASTPDYPGIEQLVPLTAALNVEARTAAKQLDQWGDLSELTARIAAIQQELEVIEQQLAGWGEPEQWSEGRLLGSRQRLAGVRDQLRRQLDQLNLLLKAQEELRLTWADRLTFWEGWETFLQRARVKVPATTFAQNRALIEGLLERSALTMAALNELQQEQAAQQATVVAWLGEIDGALTGLRGTVFERKAPAFFSGEFFAQLKPGLWLGVQEDLRSTLIVPGDFALRQGWVIMLQLLATLAIAWQLQRRARSPKPVPEQLQFLFRHPLAGGLFIALLGGGLLYVSPPPLWQLLMRVLGTLVATVLICAMLERPRLRRVIITLAVLYICATIIRMLGGLVQPLHRLFLAGVCMIAIPLCLAAARRQLQRNQGRLDLLATAFYLGTLAGGVGLVAQVAGYASLTAYLVNAVLGSTFVYLFARMALHLGSGALETLLRVEAVRSQRFFQRLGPSTGPRLNMLLRIIVIAYAVLYLLVHWQFYPTPGEAWSGVMALSFAIGELTISMEIVVMVACVLYLTMIFSWFIQALLDAEVMTPHGMDHGVKFAIKTLIHYSLILLGFLFAISVAGIDMSKFAILAGALGVGIGFGLQNIVNNFLSGLILLFERPVKVGDMISLEEQWGTITRIGLRSTVVETFDRSEIILPNSELIAQRVVNWTFSSHVVRVVLPVGVAYGTPLAKVLEVLMKAARDNEDILDNPAPSAIFIGFGDSSINFELRVWIADVSQRLRVRSELGLAVDRHFRAAGIVIPFPQRDLHLQSIAPNLQGLVPQAGSDTATSAKDPDA
jgi:small-conductance mechanosensitive channel